LTIEEFVNIINKIVALSQKLGMPADQLPNHITQEELELEKLRGEIVDIKMKKLQVL
jgi:hypothetical protein